MSIGRIVNSFFSGSNENTLSLATLNFDFSLIQIEAPKEFKPFGPALAKTRRQDAEEGKPHQTARRLGALFEDVLPSFPKLVDAFGQRVSEIVQDPKINPVGTSADGCFERFVGADGTTLWAAATSGIPAIAVYLLSCLLAQAWDSKQATALWVELVKQRQQEILSKFENNHIVSQSSLFSAKQEISREDLAIWDNSARSFLRSANQAKGRECGQLILITKNLPLLIESSGSTYASVMYVWKEALVNVEALLCGTPVDASNGLLFLAFRSWFLFPDLIVLGTEPPKHVQFHDKLFPPGGRCTVGQEPLTDDTSGGIRWSLAFSHLRYYGDPVVVQSDANSSKVTFQEFTVAVLGHIFRKWQVSQRRHDDAARWLVELWNLTESTAQGASVTRRFSWLRVLAKAAKEVLDSDPQVSKKNAGLLHFGRRRGNLFSVGDEETLLPFFGLCSPIRLTALSQSNDTNCGIALLRGIAQELGLCAADVLICHVIDGYNRKTSTMISALQVITAIPNVRQRKKRNASGEPLFEHVHARWFISWDAAKKANFDPLISECINQSERYSLMQVDSQVDSANRVLNGDTFKWPISPTMYSRGENVLPSARSPFGDESCTCPELESAHPHPSHSDSDFRTVLGDWRLGLYVRRTKHTIERERQRAHACMRKESTLPLGASLRDSPLNPELTADYLGFITRGVKDDDYPTESSAHGKWFEENRPGMFLTGHPSLPNELSKTLFTLDLASSVYTHLESATIALEASLSEPLFESEWVPTPICKSLDISKQFHPITPELLSPLSVALSREQAFSCVARFDSGHIELEPAGLHSALALCSEDSMYVAAVVLFDPFERPEAHELRRIVGNIGHPGISLLVAPEEPRIRPPSNEYTAISHVSYDFQRQNKFAGTSLHLSFTDWRFPLEAGGHRTIDQGVIVVEAVISVLDRGKWVADLDMLRIDFEALYRIINECDKHERGDHDLEYDYTSIDNWDELLDSPEGVGIFRAHGNWAARLAAVSILSQKGQGHSIGLFGAGNICFKCLEAGTDHNADYLLANESPLPSICID